MRFLLPIFLLLYFLYANRPNMLTPSFTPSDCRGVAHQWGYKWVDRDNQETRAKAIMRWTCASCGEPKDVQQYTILVIKRGTSKGTRYKLLGAWLGTCEHHTIVRMPSNPINYILPGSTSGFLRLGLVLWLWNVRHDPHKKA